MTQQSTLINAREVVTLGGLNKDFPACSVTDIWHVEQTIKFECLGEDFYNILIEDKADYSNANEWTVDGGYVAEEVVIYQGLYYMALDNVSGIIPTDTQFWMLAPKFITKEYNDLWCYLGRYIAYRVARMTVQPTVTPITGQGAIKREGETFSPASHKDISDFYSWLDANAATTLRNMDNFVISESENTDKYDTLIEFRGLISGTDCGDADSNCGDSYTTRYKVY